MKLYSQFKQHLLTLAAVGFGLGTLAPLPVAAVGFPSSTPSGGAPPRTASGAPRRSEYCAPPLNRDLDNDGVVDELTPMTVLAPTSNVISSADDRLTLFVYLPASPANTIEIGLFKQLEGNREKQVYYNDTLKVPPAVRQGPRIAAYTLNDISLEPGATYIWSLSLICEDSETWQFAQIGHMEGMVSCEAGCIADQTAHLSATTTGQDLLQTAQRYAEQALWDDTVYLTAQLRNTDPAQWQALLESQGLGCFANVPFASDDSDFAIADDPQCFVD
ncbi:MAG: DUF928 domain-containing protein [Spirulinaceae cyanobacterium]